MGNYLSVTFLVPVLFSAAAFILYLLDVSQDIKFIATALSSAVVAISVSSIGINLYNKCEDKFKNDDKAKNDKGYLIGILIMSLISLLGALFLGHKKAQNLKLL